MALVTQRVRFRDHTLRLPDGWLVDADDDNLVAVLPAEPFAPNIVMSPAPDEDDDPLAGISAIAGSVVLQVRRVEGPLPGVEVVFGYPLPETSVTVVRLLGDPSPRGRVVVTFSVATGQFAALWPAVQEMLQTIEVEP